LLWWFYRI